MKNQLKAKLAERQPVVGTFFGLGGNGVAECLGVAGLDFFIIDTEHGPLDIEGAVDYIRTAERWALTPLVRVKNIERSSILQMLDAGAQGLLVPCIERVEQVEDLIAHGMYPPLGNRGFAYGRGAGYGYSTDAATITEYMEHCNDDMLLLPQCETRGCLDQIEAIAALAGVGGIFIGPYDLSIALGKPGQFQDAEIKAAIQRIQTACAAVNKPVFIYAPDEKSAVQHFQAGIHGVAVGTDAGILIGAYQKMKQEILADLTCKN